MFWPSLPFAVPELGQIALTAFVDMNLGALTEAGDDVDQAQFAATPRAATQGFFFHGIARIHVPIAHRNSTLAKSAPFRAQGPIEHNRSGSVLLSSMRPYILATDVSAPSAPASDVGGPR
jgi:hypothetical protein